LSLARRLRAVILEDDHSLELRFRGSQVPALRAVAGDDDLVLYARGFGKDPVARHEARLSGGFLQLTIMSPASNRLATRMAIVSGCFTTAFLPGCLPGRP
jgi:hypothetical protein